LELRNFQAGTVILLETLVDNKHKVNQHGLGVGKFCIPAQDYFENNNNYLIGIFLCEVDLLEKLFMETLIINSYFKIIAIKI